MDARRTDGRDPPLALNLCMRGDRGGRELAWWFDDGQDPRDGRDRTVLVHWLDDPGSAGGRDSFVPVPRIPCSVLLAGHGRLGLSRMVLRLGPGGHPTAIEYKGMRWAASGALPPACILWPGADRLVMRCERDA